MYILMFSEYIKSPLHSSELDLMFYILVILGNTVSDMIYIVDSLYAVTFSLLMNMKYI